MSWARVVATLVIIFGFIGYAYYAAVTTAQKLYERGVLKEPPVPMVDARAIAAQVAQYTAIAVTLLIIAIVVKRLVESKRLLGIVPVKDFQRHLLIVGPTGSGKTNTAKQAISLAIRRGVKVVILDWKALPLRKPQRGFIGTSRVHSCGVGRAQRGEYVGFVKGATVIRKVNPWENGGRSAKECAVLAVETLREVTRDVADVSSASAALLLRELVKLYERGVPRTSDVISALERFFNTAMVERRLAEANMAAALMRRLMWLQIDEERASKNVIGSDRVVIYDLSELGSIYLKTIYSLSVLSKTYYEALRQGQSQTLKTLLVAEECQNYVRGRRFDDPPSIGERMANELRAYGVGMAMISPDHVQIPWHLTRDVAAVVSFGYIALPDEARELFTRTTNPRRPPKIQGNKVFIHHNGRIKTTRPPKRPPKTIDLKTETREEETAQEQENVTMEEEAAEKTAQEKIEEEPAEEPSKEAPPLRLEEEEDEVEETEKEEKEESEAEAPVGRIPPREGVPP